jgi:SAM-dependent methyltransferase
MIELRHASTADTTTTTQTAYDQLYSHAGVIQHWDSFYEWIVALLNPEHGARLLDISCGTGQLLKAARRAHLQAIGIDFSAVAVHQAQVHGTAWIANGEQLPIADQSFDYVLNLGSLEHFEDMASGVREMARVLKRDGICCILVPNTFGLLWTIWHAKNTGNVFDDGQPLQRYGTHQQWKQLFETNGLVVRRTVAYELPPPRTPGQLAFYLRHPKVHMTKLLLWRVIPINLASMFVFFCGRKSS